MTLPLYYKKKGGRGFDGKTAKRSKEPPSLRIVKRKKMHKNTKYWSFTWGTTVTQKKLPNEVKLKKFLNNITEICVFQLEYGSIKNKEHYQGESTLVGPRLSKKQLLERFQEIFSNVNGLTLSKTYDSKAAMKYASKIESRVKGSVDCMVHNLIPVSKLYKWWADLFL